VFLKQTWKQFRLLGFNQAENTVQVWHGVPSYVTIACVKIMGVFCLFVFCFRLLATADLCAGALWVGVSGD
jgi:hypothetical protein